MGRVQHDSRIDCDRRSEEQISFGRISQREPGDPRWGWSVCDRGGFLGGGGGKGFEEVEEQESSC